MQRLRSAVTRFVGLNPKKTEKVLNTSTNQKTIMVGPTAHLYFLHRTTSLRFDIRSETGFMIPVTEFVFTPRLAGYRAVRIAYINFSQRTIPSLSLTNKQYAKGETAAGIAIRSTGAATFTGSMHGYCLFVSYMYTDYKTCRTPNNNKTPSSKPPPSNREDRKSSLRTSHRPIVLIVSH